MWTHIKREWWKSKEYSPTELKLMAEIHRCFRESQCGTNEPPELAMGGNKMPQFEISDQDLLPSVWNDKLQDGLLSTEVQDMISDITEYMALRADANVGNPNDPSNLTCYELLIWMTRDLSGAKCNDDTLKMVEYRIQYLIKLADAKIFKPEKESTRRKMLSVITSIRTTLQHKIKPIINREIANSCVREYLAELKKFGKTVLDYGFQFVYFALRDTPKLQPADICLLPSTITQSRSGLLLQCLTESPSYCTIFDKKGPSSTEEDTTATNPFIDGNNQLCIPTSLIESTKQPYGICDYLSGNTRATVKNTGILDAFHGEKKILNDFVEMHALLIELAKTFMVCDEAYKSAGIGGDLLVYGKSNNLINSLMSSLKTLVETVTKCHMRIKMAINEQEARHAGTTVASLPKGTKAWFKNIRSLSSINAQLESTLALCTEQANKIQTSSNKISAEERLEIAKKQTLYFAETAELLGDHIDRFLQRQPPIEASPNHSPRAISPRFFPSSPATSVAEKQLLPGSRGRSSTFTTGVTKNTPPPLALAPKSIQTLNTQDETTLNLKAKPGRVFTDNLIQPLTQLIKAKKSLKRLQLKNNHLTSHRTKALWETLSNCEALAEVDVTNNPHLFDVSDTTESQIESVNAFSTFIKSTKMLISLHINSCGIDPRSSAFLASCLSSNQTLEILDLGSNPLGDPGIEAICVALQQNTNIYDLRLSYIQITDAGAKHILQLLKVCTQITDVMLDDPNISTEMMQQIATQLYNNRKVLVDQANPFKNKSFSEPTSTNGFI